MSYSEPLINQPRQLLLSVGAGVLLCVFYVLLQGLCRALGEGKLSYYLADGIFSVVFCLVSFFFMVLYCGGRVRFHLILGEAAGFFLFYFSAGRYLYRILKRGAEFLKRIVELLFKPYAIIFKSFIKGMRNLKSKIFSVKFIFFKKRKAETESMEKKKKKINLFGKIHLKNPDKSV